MVRCSGNCVPTLVPTFKYSRSYRLTSGVSIFSAELMAILMAMEWIEVVKPNDVAIFSDCLSATMAITEFNSSNKIVCDIQRIHMALVAQSIRVEVVWIPGHVGFFGNDMADIAAKKALDKKNVDIQVRLNKSECKSSFKKDLKREWQEDWCKYDSATAVCFKKICPNVNFSMNRWDVPRGWEVKFHRLRSGRCRFLKSYLFSIGQHPDGKCEVCFVKDNVEHFLCVCKKFDKQRKVLKENIRRIGIDKMSYSKLLGGKSPPICEVIKFVTKCKVDV